MSDTNASTGARSRRCKRVNKLCHALLSHAHCATPGAQPCALINHRQRKMRKSPPRPRRSIYKSYSGQHENFRHCLLCILLLSSSCCAPKRPCYESMSGELTDIGFVYSCTPRVPAHPSMGKKSLHAAPHHTRAATLNSCANRLACRLKHGWRTQAGPMRATSSLPQHSLNHVKRQACTYTPVRLGATTAIAHGHRCVTAARHRCAQVLCLVRCALCPSSQCRPTRAAAAHEKLTF